MARHRKTTEDRDVQAVIDGPALEQGHASEAPAQTSDGPSMSDPIMTGEPHPAAEAAARNYAQEEIERTNANARAADERALDKDGKPRETKAERFKRLAQKRVTKALLVLSHIHNLTNSNSYSYTQEQAERIVDALVLAVEKIADGFSGNKNGKVTFTL
jgi:hypothetical protein